MIELKLKRGKEESLLRRHPWVFSGAIDSSNGEVEEGDLVDVVSSDDKFLARGICATGSIAVRVLSFEQVDIDEAWWMERISRAMDVRRALGLIDNETTNCYRLIHGEGDELPGLVVDVYGKVAVMQAHAVGIYLMRAQIAQALVDVVGVSAVYDKSSATIPFQSEVKVTDGYIVGSSVEQIIVENGVQLAAAWEGGQKTGFFIDQRDNRDLLRTYAKGRRVLNTFCYTGGFSLAAIAGGAVSVDSVDSSARAIELCTANIEKNYGCCEVSHSEITADALDFVRSMPDDAYDLIVLDPPAFAKHRASIPNALQAYKRLNAAAIKAAAAGSLLFTFSCSQAISREQFRMAVFSAAAIAGRDVRILHFLSQAADHPVNIYHPEGEYLKGLVLYIA